MDARVERLAEHIGFWSSVDAGGTDALCDAIGCKLGLSFRSGLFDVTVRVEELLSGFDVSGGVEYYGKSGELETIDDIWEATRDLKVSTPSRKKKNTR